MQIPFTSFNFSALAKDINSFFRTLCSGEFPPDCGPELVTSALKLVPAVMFLPSFLSGSLPLSRARLRLSPGRSVGLTVTGGDGSGLGLVARTAHINHTPPLTMGRSGWSTRVCSSIGSTRVCLQSPTLFPRLHYCKLGLCIICSSNKNRLCSCLSNHTVTRHCVRAPRILLPNFLLPVRMKSFSNKVEQQPPISLKFSGPS